MKQTLIGLALLVTTCACSEKRYYVSSKRELPVGTIIQASDIFMSEARHNRNLRNGFGLIKYPGLTDLATDPSQVVGHKVVSPMHGAGLISLSCISHP